ncbi:MAG: dihydropteroate synthase [Planctomycetota bacterium]|jgi:dihydropteroate synthase
MPVRPSTERLDELLVELNRGARPPAIMGVLNVTPDSFSDGGRYLRPAAALDRALQMIEQGAEIIDIGPESTRPGSEPVPPQEQLARAIPVIEAIRRVRPELPLSIDTQNAEVARAAVKTGADLVNDVSALRADPAMADVVAQTGVGVVLMHMRGTPKTMQTTDGGPVYADVVGEVIEFLRERVEFAVSRGVQRGRIIVDPGLGFGKTVDHNLELLRRLAEFDDLGVPIVVGASRKSFIGKVTGVATPDDRTVGSLACAAAAVLGGASFLRAHDVAESRRAAVMAHAIRSA